MGANDPGKRKGISGVASMFAEGEKPKDEVSADRREESSPMRDPAEMMQEQIDLSSNEEAVVDALRATGKVPEKDILAAITKAREGDIRPEYYGEEDPFEPWKIIRAKKMDFFQGNALKYLMRAGVKNPETREEDCNKAITYLKEWRDNGNSHE